MPERNVNLLRQERPTSDIVYSGRFYATDSKGRTAGGLGFRLFVTPKHLWINEELAIPLRSIVDATVHEIRGLPPRRFLEIRFINPITGQREQVNLCKFDSIGIGLYLRKPLAELAAQIVRSKLNEGQPHSVAALVENSPTAAPQPLACETCGQSPALYASFFYLISALVFSYRSNVKRRVLCEKHLMRQAAGYYGVSAFTGWLGIGIFSYPFAMYALAKNFSPALGRKVALVLGVLPTVAVAGMLYWALR